MYEVVITVVFQNKKRHKYIILRKNYNISINNVGFNWREEFTITKTTEYVYVEENKQKQHIQSSALDCLCLFYSSTTTRNTNDKNGE